MPSAYMSAENNYVQPKDIENAVGIIKSLKPLCGEKGGKKLMEQMDE
jgi:hypothetical protein